MERQFVCVAEKWGRDEVSFMNRDVPEKISLYGIMNKIALFTSVRDFNVSFIEKDEALDRWVSSCNWMEDRQTEVLRQVLKVKPKEGGLSIRATNQGDTYVWWEVENI